MLEAIVIHAYKLFPRQLALLSLLLLVFTPASSSALETPPNILWQKKVSADPAAEVILSDCKVLHNGNLAVAGLYTGTGSLLGNEFVPERDPVKGAFIAVQSPEGLLLWLHRFAGTSLADLEIDQADNIFLVNYSTGGASLLGTTLAAETDALLIYRLSLHADGSLNHLVRIGLFEVLDGFPLQTLRTKCKPDPAGYTLSLHFFGTLRFGESSYDSLGGVDVAWIGLTDIDGPVWAHHLPIANNRNKTPLLSLADGRHLSYATTQGSFNLNGQTYSTSGSLDHSLLVWISAGGEVEKTAHFHGSNDVKIIGLTQNSQGEILLQVWGQGNVSVQLDNGTALEFFIEGTNPSLKYLCISAGFTSIRWQKDVPDVARDTFGGLRCDTADNLYSVFSSLSRYIFEGMMVKDSVNQPEAYPASVLKMNSDGETVWIRKVIPGLENVLDSSPDGRCFTGSSDFLATGISSILFLASDLASSAPEFHDVPLANQVVAAQSTLYLNPIANGASDTIYYWLKDGVDFTNSTCSSLILSNLGPTDLGTYTLLASNQFGSVLAGPFRFSLGVPSKLAKAELLQHIDTDQLYSLEARFSPSGRNNVLCGYSLGTLYQGANSYQKATFGQVTIGNDSPSFFVIEQPGTPTNPKSVITDDGQCFVIDSLYDTLQRPHGWIARFDSSGGKLWEQLSTGNNGILFYDLALSKKTNLIVLAFCRLQTGLGTKTFAKNGLYLIRLSFDGEVLSTKLLLESESTFSVGTKFCFAPDDSGYVITSSPFGFKLPGGETYSEDQTRPLLLLRFDTDGDVVWHKRLPEPYYYVLSALACDAQGMVTGINYNGQPDLPGLPPLQLDEGLVIIRWNKDGQPEWHKVFDNPGQRDMAHALTMDAAGNIVLGLLTQDDIQLDNLFVPYNPGAAKVNNQQSILVRLSRTGKVTDAFRIPSDASTIVTSLELDPKGRVLYTAGISSPYFDTYTYRPIVQIGPHRITQGYGVGGFYGITAPLGPTLLSSQQDNEFTFSWSEYLSDFTLESSPSPAGPWIPITTSTNSITIEAGTSGNQFFRLKENTE